MYTKKDMVFTDYKWTAGADKDNPHVTGKPDSTLLNRTEGYEMLYFINRLAFLWNWNANSIPSMQHLERIIRMEVPSNIRSHGGMKKWIEDNYKQI